MTAPSTGSGQALNPDALRPMIISMNGDVTAVAEEIGADSEDLRNFIMNTPRLRRALEEVTARAVDKAVGVLFKGLADEDHFNNQIAAAKEVLKTRPAQRRGFHHAGDLELKVPSSGGALTLTWLPPEAPQPQGPLIEGRVEEEGE